METAAEQARARGYKFWKAFTTGKPLSMGGVPHDRYGMTTNSVHEYVLGTLRKLGLKEENVTKVMTGVDLMLSLDASMVDRAKAAIQKARIELAKATTLNEARELLEDSATGLKQMSGLVLNLKGFARVDRDGMDTIDLNDSVRSALTIAGHQLRDRITVVEELGDVPKVKCMPSQINQVFLNMITNAAQAMGDSGTLTIRSIAKPSFVEVSFEDTGTGIPDDVLPKIFDPFFTTKPVGEGTGLGLSIVHKIIQGHGGAIRVKSQVGKGTTFFVELPLAQKPVAKAA